MSNVNLQIEFIVSLIKQVSYVDYAHHASKRTMPARHTAQIDRWN